MRCSSVLELAEALPMPYSSSGQFFIGKKSDLWIAFVDLEKAFDRVLREVVWWTLQDPGVD